MDAIKKVIKSIVISCPENVTVAQLQRDYREIEGCPLPHRKFGFESPDQMLRSFGDVIKVCGYGPKAIVSPVISEKSEHIVRLVTEQKSARKRRSPALSRNNVRFEQFHSFERCNRYKDVCITRAKTKCQHHKHQRNVRSIQNLASVKEEEPKHIRRSNQPIDNKANYSSNWIRNNNSPYKGSSKSDNYKVCVDTQAKEVPMVEKDKYTSSTANHSRNIAWDILCNYQEEVEVAQKEKQKETRTISSTVKSKEDNNQCDKKHPNEWELNSFELKELEDAFSELNLSAISALDISNCDEDAARSESSSSGIFFKPKPFDSKDYNEAVPDFAFDKRIFLLDFPDLTVKFGVKLKPFEMPRNVTVESIISIYISEIHNPYRFWFHLYKGNCELDDLMNDIEHFYRQIEGTLAYTILPEQIQTGQVCATLFNGLWHRAEILQNYLIDGRVKVFFMDYGTVCDVEISTLKYLRIEFAVLPAFGCRGCLAEINPIRLHWSTGSSLAFLSMAYDRLLHGKVCEIDEMNKVYYLTLCDTHERKVTQINRELINLNHALKSFEWSKKRQFGKPRLRHKREDYPTFDMLEQGDYPSLTELIDMESKSIFYETITDKMIYHPRILNFEKESIEALRNLPFMLLANNPFANDIIANLTEKVSS